MAARRAPRPEAARSVGLSLGPPLVASTVEQGGPMVRPPGLLSGMLSVRGVVARVSPLALVGQHVNGSLTRPRSLCMPYPPCLCELSTIPLASCSFSQPKPSHCPSSSYDFRVDDLLELELELELDNRTRDP